VEDTQTNIYKTDRQADIQTGDLISLPFISKGKYAKMNEIEICMSKDIRIEERTNEERK
jgi:hypothetical protein